MFIKNLQHRIQDLQEVFEVDKCDFILVFCPVVSRAGTDIDAALEELNNLSGNPILFPLYSFALFSFPVYAPQPSVTTSNYSHATIQTFQKKEKKIS